MDKFAQTIAFFPPRGQDFLKNKFLTAKLKNVRFCDRGIIMLFVVLGFILFFLLVSGLWFSKQILHREELAKKARSKARTVKQQITDIEDICTTLNMYDANVSLLTTIYSHIISLMQKVISLENTQENHILLEHYENKKNKLAETLPIKVGVPENDHQISILKRHTGKAITYLKGFIAQGLLNEYEGSEHITRLRRLKVQSEVDAFLLQGNKCEQKYDKITAASYYKHAKELLLSTDVNFDNQTEQIKSISKKISKIFNSEEEEKKREKEKRLEREENSHPLTTVKKTEGNDGNE
ncbi:hypothetical protein [Marinicellulosiphila megalodicopiae]|uniref:hypothetical protein n=1 Tax=Marinicellulosiphila megalodicopiae TaxID=2724896 RepID=UPI003BB1A023